MDVLSTYVGLLLLLVMALYLWSRSKPARSLPKAPQHVETNSSATSDEPSSKLPVEKKSKGRGTLSQQTRTKGHESGLLLTTLKGHTDDVTDACFAPDGVVAQRERERGRERERERD